MEKTLNLIEILRNVPVGTKFYSPIFGELSFMGINMSDFPITFIDERGTHRGFTKKGEYFRNYHNAECTIFPSKDNRNWNAFKIEPKFDITTLQPFDKVLGRYDNNNKWTCDFYEYYDEGTKSASCVVEVYDQCIPYNDETKHLVGTKNDCPKFYKWWE